MRLILSLLLFFLISSFSIPASVSAQSCPQGDANNDCRIDGVDYVTWLNNFNKALRGPGFGDFDNNGFIDGIDYVIWLNNYGKKGISVSPTPIPTVPVQSEGYGSIVASFQNIRSQSLWPVAGFGIENVESTFGPRIKVSSNAYDWHRGIDIDAPINTPVLAPLDGVLWNITVYPDGGLTVILRHQFPQRFSYQSKQLDYFYTFYMHLNSVTQSLTTAANAGQHPSVARGMEIGKVGHSGSALGDHLHLELRVGSYCSLEFQLGNPSSSCSGFNFDPAMHSLFLFPPRPQNPNLTIVTKPDSTIDGKINYSSSPDAPFLNRIEFKIIDKSTQQALKSHTLDFNQRIGFNPSSTARLDTPDKSAPYLSPVSFGVNKDPYETNIIIPGSYVGSYSGANYTSVLAVTNIWEQSSEIRW